MCVLDPTMKTSLFDVFEISVECLNAIGVREFQEVVCPRTNKVVRLDLHIRRRKKKEEYITFYLIRGCELPEGYILAKCNIFPAMNGKHNTLSVTNKPA